MINFPFLFAITAISFAMGLINVYVFLKKKRFLKEHGQNRRISYQRFVAQSFLLFLLMILVGSAVLAPVRYLSVKSLKNLYEGTALVIAVDTSRSMNAEDIDKSGETRLGKSQKMIINSLENFPLGVYWGLIGFTRHAMPYCYPLSRDINDIVDKVSRLNTIHFTQGANLFSPLHQALEMFRFAEKEDKEFRRKIIIVFTDGGGPPDSSNPLEWKAWKPHNALGEGASEKREFADKLREANAIVYFIGMGEKNLSIIPDYNVSSGRYKINDKEIYSSLSEDALKSLASTLDGKYFHHSEEKRFVKDLREEIKKNSVVVKKEIAEIKTINYLPHLLLTAFVISLCLIHLNGKGIFKKP